jgi:ABC-type nitrate/sulfonate/bicarbonate transport system permease component
VPGASRWRQYCASLLLVLVAWQVMSYFFPPFLVPSVPRVATQAWRILTERDTLLHAGATFARILAGLSLSFVLGFLLGLVMALYRPAADLLLPIVHVIQGVPSLSWVIIAVIWFRDMESRALFVLLASGLPNFSIQIHDAVRDISRELWEMVQALRPTRRQMLRHMILPAIVPEVFTAWKVNLGISTRVVIIAELVGSTFGIGYQLRLSQDLFNMAAVVAWTLALVLFALVGEQALALLEKRLLRWRPALGR